MQTHIARTHTHIARTCTHAYSTHTHTPTHAYMQIRIRAPTRSSAHSYTYTHARSLTHSHSLAPLHINTNTYTCKQGPRIQYITRDKHKEINLKVPCHRSRRGKVVIIRRYNCSAQNQSKKKSLSEDVIPGMEYYAQSLTNLALRAAEYILQK